MDFGARSQLSRHEPQGPVWNELVRTQQASGIAQGAAQDGEAEMVVRLTPSGNDRQVLVTQHPVWASVASSVGTTNRLSLWTSAVSARRGIAKALSGEDQPMC